MIHDIQGILAENECRTCGCIFGNHSGEKYWARHCGWCLQLFCASCDYEHTRWHDNMKHTPHGCVVVWDWRNK